MTRTICTGSAELGSDDVLALEGPAAMPWAAKFLTREDDAAAEAAMAIAQTYTPEAFQILRTAFAKAGDPWFRTAVLSAVALTRQQEATHWLLDLIAKQPPDAADAHQALCLSAPSTAIIDRLKKLGRPVFRADPNAGMATAPITYRLRRRF